MDAVMSRTHFSHNFANAKLKSANFDMAVLSRHHPCMLADAFQRCSQRLLGMSGTHCSQQLALSLPLRLSTLAILQVLFRGTCNGCWNVRNTLQSECGKCKVRACKACRDKWAEQRQHGRHADPAGLYVPQANVCFCGAHLTPRGAAAYSRKVISNTSAHKTPVQLLH